MPELNEEQFKNHIQKLNLYHGTVDHFEPLDELIGGHGSPNFDLSGKHVYVTSDPHVARAYGEFVAKKRNEAEGRPADKPFWKGEVYHVAAVDADWDENEAIDFPETKTDPSKRKWFKAPAAMVIEHRPDLSEK
ncbi:hypothetical protein UFOVP45_130 [uncultured Caudovirales phage]|uniref:Uncharacterized protein n=1 Tax=uncultured Caudovirales phage TaxID=2100421 RepID=A0A6J5KVH0_9CAUD|nr:hypothetical protein UFOVP45_130 [uncultured Caudovirales phage]